MGSSTAGSASPAPADWPSRFPAEWSRPFQGNHFDSGRASRTGSNRLYPGGFFGVEAGQYSIGLVVAVASAVGQPVEGDERSRLLGSCSTISNPAAGSLVWEGEHSALLIHHSTGAGQVVVTACFASLILNVVAAVGHSGR